MRTGKILFVTSTEIEKAALLRVSGIETPGHSTRFGRFEIYPLTAGIGAVSTIYTMCSWIAMHGKPDLAINAGIAGSFSTFLKPGDVVMPASDCFADLGVDNNGSFLTLFETGLADPDDFPYRAGILESDNTYTGKLSHLAASVRAITVNTASGSEMACEKLRKKYNPDIETMEGAAFFYICLRESIPFFGLRAISNIVEPRNRKNWNIELALSNLTARLEQIFLTLD